MEQRDVLRHDGDGLAQAFLRDVRDVLSVDQDAAALDVVESLQQREQRRFSAAGPADQADPLAGLRSQVEVLENLAAVGIAEGDILELDALRRAASAAPPRDDRAARAAAAASRAPRRDEPMLRDIDQRYREVARGVQNGRPSVQISTTSPVVAYPRCHRTIAQASTPTVSKMVTRRAACVVSPDRAGCAAAAVISRSTVGRSGGARGRGRRRR